MYNSKIEDNLRAHSKCNYRITPSSERYTTLSTRRRRIAADNENGLRYCADKFAPFINAFINALSAFAHLASQSHY